MSKRIDLSDKNKCCGCLSCTKACPKNAITTTLDDSGIIYPEICLNECVDCGLCSRICNYKNNNYQLKPKKGYAAITKDKDLLNTSTSGGVFSTIAKKCIKDGWKVCGCISYFNDNKMIVEHILTDNVEDIEKMQGSKYVQSSIVNVLNTIKNELNKGTKILFSGTPCQISAIKGFLQKKYDNLVTMEIICHGAPSQKLLNDYIEYYNRKKKCTITDLSFRSKKYGWKNIGIIKYKKDNSSEIKIKDFIFNESSYYYLFEKGYFFRESCYNCQYAGENRIGDITIGDYWGIEKVHPEILKKIDIKMGVSCIIINSTKGERLVDECKDLFSLYESSFENIRKYNKQLNAPTEKPNDLDDIVAKYKKEGYSAIEKFFKKKYGNYKIQKLKNRIKKILKKL